MTKERIFIAVGSQMFQIVTQILYNQEQEIYVLTHTVRQWILL